MSSFVFPGYPAYLEAAAGHIARPESARGAGRLVALTALANLCAQASRAEPLHRDAILLKACEFRDQLAVALRAADAMLADVRAVETVPDPEGSTDEFPTAPVVGCPASRKTAKRRLG